jgi:hypothetical protein
MEMVNKDVKKRYVSHYPKATYYLNHLKIDAITLSYSLNVCKPEHTSFLQRQVALNLNERILKLWESTRPFGTKVNETNFFTPSDPLHEFATE